MLEKLITAIKIPELRQKILLTLGLLAVYRMGFAIPLPFVDQETMFKGLEEMKEGGGGLGMMIEMVSLFSASKVGNATIFGLGIMPYISASIIFQLLASVYPPLERLKKEGEAGQRKINEYTRYATVVICLVQSYFWIGALSGGLGSGQAFILKDYDTFYFHIVCTITMTAGTVFLMWIGEQIDAYGIGNGISLLIMAGILARMPTAGKQLLEPTLEHGPALGGDMGIDKLILLTGLFV
ncbi:MAG: preprotein translocase subunit SecY, partial [Planctomycetes bacterium]|nr:preprotein translocase subunit SecY [Planctomycetota bacterium]